MIFFLFFSKSERRQTEFHISFEREHDVGTLEITVGVSFRVDEIKTLENLFSIQDEENEVRTDEKEKGRSNPLGDVADVDLLESGRFDSLLQGSTLEILHDNLFDSVRKRERGKTNRRKEKRTQISCLVR